MQAPSHPARAGCPCGCCPGGPGCRDMERCNLNCPARRHAVAPSLTEVVTMATGQTTATVRCPECGEPITIPVRLACRRGGNATMSFDLAPIRAHADTHLATFTTEPPGPLGRPRTEDYGP